MPDEVTLNEMAEQCEWLLTAKQVRDKFAIPEPSADAKREAVEQEIGIGYDPLGPVETLKRIHRECNRILHDPDGPTESDIKLIRQIASRSWVLANA